MKILKQLLTAVAISTCLSASAQWTQQGTEINGEAADDWSGFSVSMSADGLTVAVGAFRNDGSGTDAGHVRIYKLIGGVWTQQGADIDGEAAGDSSGISVSMSADGLTVAIGAPGNDGSDFKAGHARVYKLIGGVWTQQGADIDGEAADDSSGFRVSISDDGLTVAIASDFNDDAGVDAGHVRVYKLIGGVWTQQGADIDGEAAGDLSGFGISMSGDGLTVAIGAYQNDGNGSDAGHVRVYKLIGGVWTQQGVDIDGEAAGDNSGWSVSMSADGLTVAVGAIENDGSGTHAGHVRIYKLIVGVWTQQGADIDGEAAFDTSGFWVSISDDGLTVAIGAPNNDDSAAGAGHVRVYKFIGGVWTQQGADIDGEAAGDLFGLSASLSADGSSLAIGGYRNDGNGSDAGHVRVYGDTSLGVNETENNRQFTFYPNPSNGLLRLTGIQEETKIEIYSITGKKLFEKIVFDNSEIEIKLSTGLYLVRFTSFSKTHSKKLLIN